MKTKKLLLWFTGLLLGLSAATAQTDDRLLRPLKPLVPLEPVDTASYFNKTGLFYGDGYVYRCDRNSWDMVTLYNKENLYTYSKYMYKDGTRVTDASILRGRVALIDDDDWTRQTCFSLVNNAFSAAQKQQVKGKEFQVVMTIDTSTGKVVEVYFCFYYNNPYSRIPLSVYRTIELNLKSQIRFTLTETGKQLKFIKRGWRHEPE